MFCLFKCCFIRKRQKKFVPWSYEKKYEFGSVRLPATKKPKTQQVEELPLCLKDNLCMVPRATEIITTGVNPATLKQYGAG